MATTSFFPAKPLGCYGDGGAIFTNDDKLALKTRQLLNHGQEDKYIHKYIGLNGRLDGLQAAVLIVKMRNFENEIKTRNLIANRYLEELKNVDNPHILPNNLSVWAQYCILTDKRDELASFCESYGIPTNVYYPKPIHLQEAYSNLGHSVGDFPISEEISKKILAIPMSAFLKSKHQNFIIGVINEFRV
jgi:UDP-2-acetamido-2-deoxy-ribo-hexuluronate aminotransferase